MRAIAADNTRAPVLTRRDSTVQEMRVLTLTVRLKQHPWPGGGFVRSRGGAAAAEPSPAGGAVPAAIVAPPPAADRAASSMRARVPADRARRAPAPVWIIVEFLLLIVGCFGDGGGVPSNDGAATHDAGGRGSSRSSRARASRELAVLRVRQLRNLDAKAEKARALTCSGARDGSGSTAPAGRANRSRCTACAPRVASAGASTCDREDVD